MLKLSDIQAPAWVWRTGIPGQPPIKMRPLSLATFAEAELMGCGLDALLDSDEETALTAWANLYAFLRGDDPDEVASEVLQHPQVFAAFVTHVQSSFQSPDQEEQGHRTHRRSKDPREKIKSLEGKSMKVQAESTDYSVLFSLARFSKVSLTDIYGMTFRGLVALTQDLNDNPPTPSLFE